MFAPFSHNMHALFPATGAEDGQAYGARDKAMISRARLR